MSTPRRIAIAGFQHETNRFGATRATYRDFEIADSWPGLLRGDEVIPGLEGSTLPLAGFAEATREQAELIPILWCAAEPSSFVTDDAWERITAMILDGIGKAGAIDGIYLDLHGAMMTESHDDGEGELLKQIRIAFGADIPVAMSLDSHANISPEMVEHADAITVYRSYPHLDMDITGARCWPVMQSLLDGYRPHGALRKAPFLIPLHAQFTGTAPLDRLYDAITAIGTDAPTCWADMATGFPASDMAHTAPSIMVWAETHDKAEAAADRLMEDFIAAEGEYDCGMMTPMDAVTEAMKPAAKSVVLADVQDNPGAGGTSDTTGLLAALVAGGARDAVLGMLADKDAAREAHRVGVGGVFETRLGGKFDNTPFPCRVKVEGLSDGRFDFTGAMYRGSTADIGPCALLLVEDDASASAVRVVVSTSRCQCLDRACFTHIGIRLEGQRIIAVKSTVHFRADFDPIASKVIAVGAPGLNPCDHLNAGFRHTGEGIRLFPGGPVFTGQV